MTMLLSAGCPGLGQSWVEPSLCKSQFWKEKLEISRRILQWFLDVLCHVSLRRFSETNWHFGTAWFFLAWAAPQRHSTNSPWAWGFSFLAISSLTTTKLACITLSWSARGLDKTACWPIKLRVATLSTCTCPFNASSFACTRYNDAQSLSFHYFSVPTDQAQSLAFHFTKKNSFVHLSLKGWHCGLHQLFFSYSPSPVLANTSLLSLLSPVNHWGHDAMRWHAMKFTLMLCSMTSVMARKDRHLPWGHLIVHLK